jgi:hypothetical protein
LFVDVFNGDADGILARHQYRLVHPVSDVKLISGLKRDVKLVSQLSDFPQGKVTVFDISLESNELDVKPLLDREISFLWFDHHRIGKLKGSTALETHIDLSPSTCTSLIVNAHLDGVHLPWAIAGAYGDNLSDVATPLALEHGFSEAQCAELQQLGETLNYNGYGESREDLAAWPVDVALDLETYLDPFDYMNHSEIFSRVATQKKEDEALMGTTEILHLSTSGEIVLLPKGPASRRMSGLFSNEKVYAEPDLAHATFTTLDDGTGYRVSIRAPKARPKGADVLASQFPTGGGRAGAGGVNALPFAKLEKFINAFDEVFAC